MIDIPALRRALDEGDWVMFDPDGRVIHGVVPRDAGPATLLVAPVTDAVKTVADGRVVGSVDRSSLWRVEAFLLNRVVLAKLGEVGSVGVDELLDDVESTGFSWQAVPVAPRSGS